MFASFRSLKVSFADEILIIDVLIFSEVNCREGNVDKFEIPGLNIFSKTIREQSRGRG